MGTLGTLIENLGDAAPRMCLVENASGRSAVPELNFLLRESFPVPAAGETELARYAFLGGIMSAVDIDTGRPARQLDASGPTSFNLLPIVRGGGLVVVTDRRILGQANGESQLSGEVDPRDDGAIFFSLPYDELETVSITQKKKLLGGIQERPVIIHAADLLGFMNIDVIGAPPVPGSGGYGSKMKTSRPFFDQITQAAARYSWGLDQSQADRAQLQRLLAGQFEMEEGDVVAYFGSDDAAEVGGPTHAPPPVGDSAPASPWWLGQAND